MGNNHPTPQPTSPTESDDEPSRKYKAFRKSEVSLLDGIFRDLAARSPSKTMDKTTFLQFFNLPGILGERLFTVFDRKKNGLIDFDEFIEGLAVYYKGTTEQKIKMLFDMYDTSGSGAVSRGELTTMLHSLMTSTPIFDSKSGATIQDEPYTPAGGASINTKSKTVDMIVQECFDKCDLMHDNKLHFDDFKGFIDENPWVVEALDRVFVLNYWSDAAHESHPNEGKARGSLSRAGSTIEHGLRPSTSFTNLVNMAAAQSVVYCSCNFKPKHCYRCGSAVNYDTVHPVCSRCGKLWTGQSEGDGFHNCIQCGAKVDLHHGSAGSSSINGAGSLATAVSHGTLPHVTSLSRMSMGGAASMVARRRNSGLISSKNFSSMFKEGILYKRGARLKHWKKMWVVFRQSFLYFFGNENDTQPHHVHFLEGCFIEMQDHDEFADSGYYGFEIVSDSSHTTKVVYVRSKEERQEWLKELRKGAKSFPIEEFYTLGKQIGKGRFSLVFLGTHLKTGFRYAIKVIDKSQIAMDEREKEALRTEIAILKLVDHPNVIKMEEIFESRAKIYIVMYLVRGGDLFDRIIQRKRFKEEVARVIIWKLLSAVKYLHDRGVVHRDLKPENILCADENDDTDVIIADFGLSKFASPIEVMKLPCGTLAYVAPEVLKLQGYSHAVDVWSIGIIMFLLLRGGLPFDGKEKAEIIERTLHSKPTFRHECWSTISQDAQDLILKFLDKNPDNRITIEGAQHHSWFSCITEEDKVRFMTRPERKMENAYDEAGAGRGSQSSSPSGGVSMNGPVSTMKGRPDISITTPKPAASRVDDSSPYPTPLRPRSTEPWSAPAPRSVNPSPLESPVHSPAGSPRDSPNSSPRASISAKPASLSASVPAKSHSNKPSNGQPATTYNRVFSESASKNSSGTSSAHSTPPSSLTSLSSSAPTVTAQLIKQGAPASIGVIAHPAPHPSRPISKSPPLPEDDEVVEV